MTTVKQFSQALRRLVRVPAQIAPAVAKGIKKQIERDFSAGVDPYGKPWRALAKATIEKGRHPPPLTDSRDGRKSIKVTPTQGAGVSITVGTSYMWRHQVGQGPPVRAFIPIGTLPKTYQAVWQKALDRQVKATLGK